MRILSIQSSVAYGYAGNSSAVFCLQRLGHEVWPVHTVNFSNHTGYGSWRGPVLDPCDVAEVIAGVGERGAFAHCDAVLSGYLGAQAIGEVILDAVAAVKAANPQAVYCCDPVMGDVGRGFFVRPGIPEYLRDLVTPKADVITPNQFELQFLTGRPPGAPTTLADILDAVAELRSRGPQTVLVTSLDTIDDSPHVSPDRAPRISMLVATADGVWVVDTPRLDITPKGAGDATAAIFLARLGDGARRALELTAASIHAILQATVDGHHDELRLIPAQDEIAHPTIRFTATQVG